MSSIFENPTPQWMGIINLTPDSFSDGGLYSTTEKVIEKCLEFVSNGAHMIDFGGVATNPSTVNGNISPEEELNRIYFHIKEARKVLPKNILISVDTYSPYVAYKLAKENLIDIINDIYAAQKFEAINDLNLNTAHVAAEFNLGLILMHMPKEKTRESSYNCIENIKLFLKERLTYCKKLGIKQIAIDPGIGYGRFGKTFEDILKILQPESIHEFCKLGAPLLIGVSRKAFHLDIDPTLINPQSRDKLSKKIELECLEHGAKIIRTHQLPTQKEYQQG